MDLECEVEGQRAALHCLTTESQTLTALVEGSVQQRKEMFAKYHHIQEFQGITVGAFVGHWFMGRVETWQVHILFIMQF